MFQLLKANLARIDSEEGDGFVRALTVMSTKEVYGKLEGIQNFSLKLGFEEARELKRGRALGVLDAQAVEP